MTNIGIISMNRKNSTSGQNRKSPDDKALPHRSPPKVNEMLKRKYGAYGYGISSRPRHASIQLKYRREILDMRERKTASSPGALILRTLLWIFSI
jgi:hypothetical protein